MVLPSLKSIKTLFSPGRAGTGHGRKTKEKDGDMEARSPEGSPRNVEQPTPARGGDVVMVPIDNRCSNKETEMVPAPPPPPPPARTCTALVAPFSSSLDERQREVERDRPPRIPTSSPKEVWLVMQEEGCERGGLEERTPSGDGDRKEKTDVVKDLLERRVLELEQLLEEEVKKASDARQLLHELQHNSESSNQQEQELECERMLRRDLETRLHLAEQEKESAQARLVQAQQDLTKLEELACGLLQFKARVERLQREKASVAATYEAQLHHYQRYAADLEQENLVLVGELQALEASNRQSGGRERSLSRVLLERLRYLEAENSSLVLETEQQRLQYERCLDDVANQVVRAVLMQRGLRDECLKLHQKVKDLEQRNRSLGLALQQQQRATNQTAAESVVQISAREGSVSRACGAEGSVSSLPSDEQSPQLTPIRQVSMANDSQQSSMATQTSQSEDSLESLASFCSEYSMPGASSGLCRSSLAINVPGWPQLSSPPLWVKKHLDHPRRSLGLSSADSTSSKPSRWSLEEGIWPGLRLCDLEELAAGAGSQERSSNRRVAVASSDDDENGEESLAACLDAIETPKEEVLPALERLVGPLAGAKGRQPSPRLIHNEIVPMRPKTLNLSSRTMCSAARILPAEFLSLERRQGHTGNVYTSPTTKPFPSAVPECVGVGIVRGTSPTSADSGGRDEGYSTMSSDVPPGGAEDGATIAEERLPTEEEEEEEQEKEDDDDGEQVHGFENDLQQSLILVRERRSSVEKEVPDPEPEPAPTSSNVDLSAPCCASPAQLSTMRLVSLCAPQGFKARPAHFTAFPVTNRIEMADKGTETEGSNNSLASEPVTVELKIVEEGETSICERSDSARLSTGSLWRRSLPMFVPRPLEHSASDPLLTRYPPKIGDSGYACGRSASWDVDSAFKCVPLPPASSVQSLDSDECCRSSPSTLWRSEGVRHLDRHDEAEDNRVNPKEVEVESPSTDDVETPSPNVECVVIREPVEASQPDVASECEENVANQINPSEWSDSIQAPVTADAHEDFRRCAVDASEFHPDFYQLCSVERPRSGGNSEADEDNSSQDGGDGGGTLGSHASTQEKLQELTALLDESQEADEGPRDAEPTGKEGCTTSWIHVEADVDLSDPKARANLLDTMLASTSSGSSSSSSECGEEAPVEYQHLHQLHRYRRHRKATELENCVLRYIPPARPSILGRRDFYVRYGEQERAAVASFDFLEDLSTSASEVGSAEMLDVPDATMGNTSVRSQQSSCQMVHPPCVMSVPPDSDPIFDPQEECDAAERLSLSDSCAESYTSSTHSLNTLE